MQQKVSENNLQTEQEMQFHVQCLMSLCYPYLSFLVCLNLCCTKVIWETLERIPSFISTASLWTPVCVFVCCPQSSCVPSFLCSLFKFPLFSPGIFRTGTLPSPPLEIIKCIHIIPTKCHGI